MGAEVSDSFGSQVNIENGLLFINIESDKLNIGDKVVGDIVIQPTKSYSISQLEIKIISKEGWAIGGIDNSQSVLNNELLKQKIDLCAFFPSQNEVVTLVPNKYVIPFSFIISPTFIPSFRYPFKPKTAFLYHSLIVEMTSTKSEKWTTAKPIAIVSLYSLPISPHIQESTKEVYMMNLFSQGSNRISVSFPKTVYLYNEPISFNVFIDNSACQATLNKIEYILLRKMVYKLNGETQFNLEKKLNEKSESLLIGPGEKRSFPGVIHFKNNDKKEFEGSHPNMFSPHCNDLNELVTSVATSLIYCEYLLHINVGYSGMTKNPSKPRIIMPIFTGRTKNDNNCPNTPLEYVDINKVNDNEDYEMVPPANCIEEQMNKIETKK